jgi:hypothetical protein
MSARTVTLRLTALEAEALSRAAGNSVDHPDAMEALFSDGRERAAALRAAQKLDGAIRGAGGFKAAGTIGAQSNPEPIQEDNE